ncbi:MAG: hypothetical protein IT280_06320 [Ignavibacteria bacterium]|nr:hypothetical protein [Ignavibacteria bacterium]
MPIDEFITDEDIKSFVPELSRMLWSEETDFTPQKIQALEIIKTELRSMGYLPAEIMPRLYIRYSGTTETTNHITQPTNTDLAARLRFVLDVKQYTAGGEKIFTLQGSNDKQTWFDIDSRKAESAGVITFLITSSYLYYRLNNVITGGEIDYEAFLCDTGIERLLIYKWLELILLDRISEERDQYHLKMEYFRKEYEGLMEKMRIWKDFNQDGKLSKNEFNRSQTIKLLK